MEARMVPFEMGVAVAGESLRGREPEIFNVRLRVATWLGGPLLVSSTVKVFVSAVAGVPLISAKPELRASLSVSPAGRVPELILQLSSPHPPTASKITR